MSITRRITAAWQGLRHGVTYADGCRETWPEAQRDIILDLSEGRRTLSAALASLSDTA